MIISCIVVTILLLITTVLINFYYLYLKDTTFEIRLPHKYKRNDRLTYLTDELIIVRRRYYHIDTKMYVYKVNYFNLHEPFHIWLRKTLKALF